MKIFFNSSMPRSGSTLLQNILGNNPDIYATPTSGLVEMLKESRKVYTTSAQFKAQDEKTMKSAFLMYCRYGIEGYFRGITDREYVIDKSRAWAINYAFLNSFYPNPKIICMVRDLRDIVASMEKNYQKYPEKAEMNLEERLNAVTVGQRVTFWLQNAPVDTLNRLREVIRRGWGEKMLFVRFEDLASNPEKEMKRVYKYLEIPYYKHDFENIKQVTFEDDKFHGRYGDHIIQPSIKPLKSKAKELLGELICNQLYEKNKWYFDYFNYKL
jgi:sulfotransferase